MNTASVIPTAPPVVAAEASSRTKPQRIVALDFTKGALVMLMVLYHWLNYFVSLDGAFYKYLRFLTPSFIFITGFLVSHVYLRKYQVTDSKLALRLLQRGLKLVAIFVTLNLAIGSLAGGSDAFSLDQWSRYLAGLPGARRASFPVLLPIGYVLVLCASLSIVSRWLRKAFHVAAVLLFATVLIAGMHRQSSVYLELISVGMLGVVAGYAPVEWTRKVASHPLVMAAAYAGYLTSITIWNEIYLLQIVGVCLTLTIIYLVGGNPHLPSFLCGPIVLLGKYSLFAYVAHIAFLQAANGVTRHSLQRTLYAAVALPAAAAFTISAAAITDRARQRWTLVNKLYSAVFA